MNTRSISLLTLLLLAAPFASCQSTHDDGGMSSADQRTWQDARMHHGVAALDDRTFVLDMGEKGKAFDQKDTVEFAGSRFHSGACDTYGFGSGSYTARNGDGGIEFHAVCTNASGASNDWHGTVHGDAIEGGFTCTKSGQTPTEYTFRGHATK